MEAGSERRRHVRYPFERSLELRAADGRMVVRAFDISESGFSFISELPLHVGERIELALRYDDEFYIVAMVRNVRDQEGRYLVGAERISVSTVDTIDGVRRSA